MYDELVKRLRDAAKMSEALAVLLPHSDGNATAKLYNEAADAVEELRRSEAVALEYGVGEHNRRLALEQKHRWIPVTERLPDSGVCVLVTDGLEVGEGWLTEITNTQGHFMRWCVPMTDIDVDRRPITHWMPMPKAPEEGET